MSLDNVLRRLDQIEGSRRTIVPTRVFTDRAVGDESADDAVTYALVNWRMLVAQGRASVTGDVLCLLSPEMTEDEWAERHVTEH